ncbi:hypothetical protein ACJZ2D_009396 [Fusarium nematophilum]
MFKQQKMSDRQPSLDEFFALEWMIQYPFLHVDGWGADDDQGKRSGGSHQETKPRPKAPGKWILMSLNGAGLQASNPKDHIYGLLNLSQLDIIPDYSKEKSVGDVYRDYVAALLKAVSTGSPREWTPVDPLFFLSWAGIGLFENEVGLPSWAPNFPEDAEKRRKVPILKDLERPVPAYRHIFSEEAEPASITGSNMNVTCWFIDKIAQVHLKPPVESLFDGSLLKFFQMLVSRANSQSTSDPPLLQKMVQTMRLSSTLLVDEDCHVGIFAIDPCHEAMCGCGDY